MGALSIRGRLLSRLGLVSPAKEFHSDHYLRHNQRRQEHLTTLGLPLAGRSVLEVGAGIGDHTSFFIDRGCAVVITEAREANLAILRRRFPGRPVRRLDLDAPDHTFTERFDVVYCYGVLYHLSRPAEALAYLAGRCDGLLLLETCVTPGDEVALNPEAEAAHRPSQASSGLGCRPTRPWVMAELSRHFEHAYVTTTQPWHEEFPLDWSQPSEPGRLTRSVFVASRDPIDTPLLTESPPQRQVREYPVVPSRSRL
jgi:SAM-dependent methyltransferase